MVTTTPEAEVPPWALPLSRVSLAILVGVMLWGAWELVYLLKDVPWDDWLEIILSAGWTLLRVLTALVLGTLWTLPLGLAIGLSPKWSRIFQPIVQVAASFPAPMLFPAAIAALAWFGVSLNWGSVLLMLLGTQWYILFNVIAGAMAIPADLKEAARCYRFGAWQRFRVLYLPAAFSSLVTGWVTAAGGAWNASIVTEYVIYNKKTLEASGLGAQISKAAEHENFPLLAAGVIVMAVIVVVFNRTVWKRLYRLAEERYSLNR